MKRLISLLLVLGLCALPGGALAAQDGTIACEGLNGFEDRINQLCALDNVLWMSSDNAVYAYDTATDTLTATPWSDARRAAQSGLVYDDEGLKCYATIVGWFAHEGSVNVVLDKWRISRDNTLRFHEGMTLGKVVLNEGVADIEETGTLDWKNLLADESDSLNLSGAFVQDGTLCSFVQTLGGALLVLAPLDGSRARTVSLVGGWMLDAIAWNDGLMLFREADSGDLEYAFMALTDNQPGRWNPLPAAEDDTSSLSGMVQCGEELLYMSGKTLMAFTPESGAVREIVNIPIALSGSHGFVTPSGVYATGDHDGVVMRLLDRSSLSNDTLTVNDVCNAENMNSALGAFQNAYPSLNIAMVCRDDVLSALLTRSSEDDVIILPAEAYGSRDLSAILSRGWARPLESDALREAVSQMYPEITDLLIQDGQLLAFPFDASATGPTLCAGALRLLDMDLSDVPTNWPDFLDWLGALTPTASVSLIDGMDDAEQIRSQLIQAILYGYALEIQSGAQDAYDTPLLRAALEAVDRLDIESLIRQFEETCDEAACNPLFNVYQTSGVTGATYADDYDDIPLYLSLSASSPRRLALSASVALINPFSKHVDEAVRFIETLAQQDALPSLALLSPHQGSAQRSTDYERETAAQELKIAQYEELLENASEETQNSLEADLENARRIREEMENWYWTISEESLTHYRAAVECVLLDLSGSFFPFSAMGHPYLSGEASLDEFLSELQRAYEMQCLEAY